ncbi:hypothetical protein QAD02_024165 [Eretmocerus hayati]|uniref:Uncharacterized protein n=1 Tax=Eretmocerus hayati TaxID=131215 RepID=A0ACC2PY84_9HYME|nr:hypothetical protein QAD02_024165 [Eretmocerus hayati]
MVLPIDEEFQNESPRLLEPQANLKKPSSCGEFDAIQFKPELGEFHIKYEPEEAVESIGPNDEVTNEVAAKDFTAKTGPHLVTPSLKRKRVAKGEQHQQRKRRRKEAKRARKPKQEAGSVVNFILFEHPDDTPMEILSRAANDHGVKLRYSFSKDGSSHVCSISFNNAEVAQAVGSTRKEAKMNAAAAGLQQLQKYDYTIRVTEHRSKLIHRDDFQSLSAERKVYTLDHHNIGFKMMTSMGWFVSGELGKLSQGTTQPVIPDQKLRRRCIGFDQDRKENEFLQKCFNVLEDYIREDTLDELKFSSFTHEEMSLIEFAAQKMKLLTKRSGKVNRILRVMKVRYPKQKLNLLLKSGGSLGNYQLIKPTVCDYL